MKTEIARLQAEIEALCNERSFLLDRINASDKFVETQLEELERLRGELHLMRKEVNELKLKEPNSWREVAADEARTLQFMRDEAARKAGMTPQQWFEENYMGKFTSPDESQL